MLTGSHDFGARTPYEGVQIGKWNEVEQFRVWYATKRQHLSGAFARSFDECKPNTVYLNSMFSLQGTIVPILRLAGNSKIRTILAPRGMLKPSALAGKTLKKRIWIRFLKTSGLNKRIHFHATSADEASEIQDVFGTDQPLSVIPNLPKYPIRQLPNHVKKKGEAKLVFVGRVHPIKNLDYVIRILKSVTCERSELKVVGPIEDNDYHAACQLLCQQLPPNINVQFLGSSSHDDTCAILAESDALILPTQGENFGHAIFEAFALGVPTIISDQTCWRNLQNHRAGWDLPLHIPNLFTDAINQVVQMDHIEHERWRVGALTFAHEFFKSNDLLSAYIRMFFPNALEIRSGH